MRNVIPVFVASALAVSAVVATGQEKSGENDQAMFKSLDKNGDQRISKSEAAGDKMLTEHFSMIDTDGDGYISESEYMAHMQQMRSSKKSQPKEY